MLRLIVGQALGEQRAAGRRLRRGASVCAAAACLVLAATQADGTFAQQAPERVQGDDPVRSLLTRYCFECHAVEKPKGDLRLDRLSTDFADESVREQWTVALKRVEAGEMPPKSKPRPSEKEVRALSDWISARVELADASQRAAQGRVVLRRLNRTEYENTICDLLGINLNLRDQLPADGSADGFDNAGVAQHTSSFLMEKYLEAADTALNAVVANRPNPPPRVDKRY